MNARLEEALKEARNDDERARLIAHATTEGECDAEHCPWASFKESLCIRKQSHHENCRCPDCCEADYED